MGTGVFMIISIANVPEEVDVASGMTLGAGSRVAVGGANVSALVASWVGAEAGSWVGTMTGTCVGAAAGTCEGTAVGMGLGAMVGSWIAITAGASVVATTSVIFITVDGTTAGETCSVSDLVASTNFVVSCAAAPDNGAALNFVIINP